MRYKSKKVAIIDYQLGNLFSVEHACEVVGLSPVITSDKDQIISADGLILPGVGAFGNAINNLRRLDLIRPIKDCAVSGKPLLGICLGMQLLLTESEEFGNYGGLDIISGSTKKFETKSINKRIKVPHIGWNKIFRLKEAQSKWNDTPLRGRNNGEYMYFVHSYFAVPNSTTEVLSITDYEGIEYCSSMKKKNVFATQFHPEKSGLNGLKIYQNWADSML